MAPAPRTATIALLSLLGAGLLSASRIAAAQQAREVTDEPPAPATADDTASEESRTPREPWQHFGLLRGRDLSPFGFLRLDMRPPHAQHSKDTRWGFSVDLGYQNTWAVGGAADPYLESLSGRRELSPADWNAIRAGGEAFLVDLELALLDATVSYWVTDRLSVFLIASGVRYQGGFLDGTIESFHARTGLGDFQRDTSARNDVNILVNLKRQQAEFYEAPIRDGLLDPTIGVRYTLARVPEPWKVVVEFAAKVPLEGGGPRPLLSTGVTDWGSQVTVEYVRGRNAWHFSSAVVRTGGVTPVESSRRWLPSAIVGYERGLTPNASMIVQGQAGRSPYRREDTDLLELRRDKFQVSLGLRLRAARTIWSLAITDNLRNLDNTPDVGLQLGFTLAPRRN